MEYECGSLAEHGSPLAPNSDRTERRSAGIVRVWDEKTYRPRVNVLLPIIQTATARQRLEIGFYVDVDMSNGCSPRTSFRIQCTYDSCAP